MRTLFQWLWKKSSAINKFKSRPDPPDEISMIESNDTAAQTNEVTLPPDSHPGWERLMQAISETDPDDAVEHGERWSDCD